MTTVFFRFYAELGDFLPVGRRGTSFPCSFAGRKNLKQLIEAAGVPPAEVDLVLVNGASVDLSHVPAEGDRISVYPVFESFDISALARVRGRPLRRTRFVLDSSLAKLAAYLRTLGFDALCPSGCTDEELARLSLSERRILLTRDRSLLKRAAVTHGYHVRESVPRAQLAEVLNRFDL